jgi:hypothetical protein
VECNKTIHTKSSIAYKFIEKDRSLVFSGDCDYDDKFINFSKDANVLGLLVLKEVLSPGAYIGVSLAVIAFIVLALT